VNETMGFLNFENTMIIAEIGVNHEGDIHKAEKMIQLAAECGVDAVKFQTYSAENYVSIDQPERFERVKGFQLSYENFLQLAHTARQNGVIFFSTPLHPTDVDALDPIVPFYKISSGDLTYLELIEHIATKGKPIIISTGLGTKEEIQKAVDTIYRIQPDFKTNGKLALLHCVAAYPAPCEEANLKNISWLQESFGLPVGYSDHTLGIEACKIAVALGSVIIEKHFTYSKENQTFHDHAISANPNEMKVLVQSIRSIEKFLGKKERSRTQSEEKMVLHMRRSIGASVDIPAGVRIKKEWLTYLRPAWGLSPDRINDVINGSLRRPVRKGEILHEEDLILP